MKWVSLGASEIFRGRRTSAVVLRSGDSYVWQLRGLEDEHGASDIVRSGVESSEARARLAALRALRAYEGSPIRYN